MSLISSQDRVRLYRVVNAHIPLIHDDNMKTIFTLMLALLKDYETLETNVRRHLHALSEASTDIEKMKSVAQGIAKDKNFDDLMLDMPSVLPQ